MRKPLLVLALLLIFGLTAVLIGLRLRSVKQAVVVPDDRLNVVATFYPLGDFAQHVGGEDVVVTLAAPNGTEPHEFEPTLKDVERYEEADVFIMNGGEVDAWAKDVADEVSRRGGTVVNMSSVIELTGDDPHIWLDPVYAKRMATAIADALAVADKEHAIAYARRAFTYETALSALDTDFATGLKQCRIRHIIVAHDAFSYLAKRYTFTAHPILGLSPEEEPSAKKMAELSALAKRLKVTVVFFEELTNPAFAETVADEARATVKVLSPLEGLTKEDEASGKGYIELMQENLTALRGAMLCQ
jgi:zinc transport system substrate-binding protein